MPTWYELCEHARTKYKLDDLEDDWFSLVWTYESGRTQRITVSRYEAYEREWIEFRSYVCEGKDMKPRVALRKNDDFDLGALALDDEGDYALIYNALLATLDPDEFAIPLEAIAATADELEHQLTAGDEF
ncbi:hypothetical protein JMF97_24065 [Micromonospora fiedleri]|uniref:Uncharacterized protein n=1 Tax=Micromonospora fiedleri TaxID=1157498 RepID=A0ABS1UWH3_9ACTN|nr:MULTISPECIES: hypothetical protein [Micromonospora]MBL6279235.1 hypothetical protein [Micromonospora fiedleri]WSK40017.1 hypothetical protein OG712_15785 [Micromonospora maris]